MSRRSNIKTAHTPSRGEQLVASLNRGLDNERICKWPGEDGFEFVLVPLDCDQLQLAGNDALKRFAKLDQEITLLNHDNFITETNIQILARSIRDIDDETRATRLFKNGAQLRKLITPEVRNQLTTEWLELEAIANPDIDELDEDVVASIREAVKKKDLSELRSFGSNTLACFLTCTVSPSSS